jgi:hypothetical protein
MGVRPVAAATSLWRWFAAKVNTPEVGTLFAVVTGCRCSSLISPGSGGLAATGVDGMATRLAAADADMGWNCAAPAKRNPTALSVIIR